MNNTYKDTIIGRKFGKLIVISSETRKSSKKSYIYYKCLCECGITSIIEKYNLLSGKTKSCGCGRNGAFVKKSIEDLLVSFKIAHGDKYDYSLMVYINTNTLIKIICPIHGIFTQQPCKHKIGRGCPKCGRDSSNKNRKYTLEEAAEISNKIHNHLYTYLEKENRKNYLYLKILCEEHGPFWQAFVNHKAGNGCPKCKSKISRGEREWLNYLKIPDDKEHRQVYLINNNGKKYVVDGYDPETNTVYEFHGDFWHGNPEKYDQNQEHPVKYITFGEAYKNTIERENIIKKAGYNLIVIWESEWRKINKKVL